MYAVEVLVVCLKGFVSECVKDNPLESCLVLFCIPMWVLSPLFVKKQYL